MATGFAFCFLEPISRQNLKLEQNLMRHVRAAVQSQNGSSAEFNVFYRTQIAN